MSITRFNGGPSPFSQIRRTDNFGNEYWSARDLAPIMGYSAWRNFETPLDRAVRAAENQGHDAETHFARSRKMVDRPQGGGVAQDDFHLSRFAAYLVAMNGDPNKPEVAAAQSYFAIQTRMAETRQAPSLDLSTPAGVLAMAQQLVQTAEQLVEADAKIVIMQPKADYVDGFVAPSQNWTFRQLSANLDIQESKLRSLLIARKWIYMDTEQRFSAKRSADETRYRYTAYADKARYFFCRPQHKAPLFKGQIMHTLYVTPPGAVAIARLVNSLRDGARVLEGAK